MTANQARNQRVLRNWNFRCWSLNGGGGKCQGELGGGRGKSEVEPREEVGWGWGSK